MVEKREGKRPFVRLQLKCENNIKMDFKQMTHTALVNDQWQAFVYTVMSGKATLNKGNFLNNVLRSIQFDELHVMTYFIMTFATNTD